jgi:hypothetical protein
MGQSNTVLPGPGGGRYLALQFPTRFLDKQTYAYQMDGDFSRFNKPVVVNEAELALSDALYPVGPIVGGPNSQTLSKNYSKALNSLIPTFENIEVHKQREKMRAWLMKETKHGNAALTVDTRLTIPGIDAATAKQLSDTTGMTITASLTTGTPITDLAAARDMALQPINAIKRNSLDNPRVMTRIEYADSLVQAYLNDRKTWELQRDDMIREASEKAVTDPQSMEKLTRRLGHITAIEEAKLGSKYADAVVRGYSHTVRGFMGHLDIKSTAESLHDAKDSLRESALSSVYAASQVYPVAMHPIDWFEALDTGFTREDLSQDPELIEAAIQAKSQLIDALESQIANLRSFNKGDPTTAKKTLADAAVKREKALTALSQKYTASTISAVKLALETVAVATGGGAVLTAASTGMALLKEKDNADPAKKSVLDMFGGDSTKFDDIGTQMDVIAAANAEVNSASRALTEQMSEYASAVAGETTTIVGNSERQLTSVKAELADLQESYTIARRAPAEIATLEKAGKLPSGNGGSRWSEVHVSSTVENDYTSVESIRSSSVNSARCNFWIGSHSSSSSSASASNQTRTMSETLGVDVGMRTTYVTVDRSGWFDPSLLDMSKSFMRGSDVANYNPWEQWKEGHDIEQAAAAIRENGPDKPTGYLVAFPVGYILVKDCVIKITSSSADTSAFKSHFDQQSESSGGFLCFSHSSASCSKETGEGIVVRIPGPQILGYIMQLTGKDESQPFRATSPEELFLEDADTAATAAGAGANTNQPAHAIAPAPPFDRNGSSSGLNARGSTVRRYDDVSPPPAPVGNVSDTNPRSGGASIGVPAHVIQDPMSGSSSSKPAGHLLDALQTALDDSDVARWLGAQPAGAKEELWGKLTEAFGKVSTKTG